MSSSRDPFGCVPRKSASSTQPITVVAHPGQEVRIVVPDGAGAVPALGDSRSSPAGSGDSRSSPSGSGDSRSSPSGSGDVISRDPFGFRTYRRGFSPTPITIVAQAGQEIRVVGPDAGGA